MVARGWRLTLWDTSQAGECGGGRGGPPCPSGIIESTPPLPAHGPGHLCPAGSRYPKEIALDQEAGHWGPSCSLATEQPAEPRASTSGSGLSVFNR